MTQTNPHSTPALDEAALQQLRSTLAGELVLPSDSTYDELRTLWNGRYDRRPALLIRPANSADVALAITFARTHSLPLAVRGGGHSTIGESACDDGLTLDLRSLNSISVDPANRTIVAGGGITAGALAQAAQAHGLAVPTGALSVIGIGGLTTGGGMGLLMRKYGLTIDNLLEVEIVTADGQVQLASASQNPDLFWAVRGGSGNFGVITRFTYQAHEIGTMVYSGPLVFTLDKAADALRAYREFMATAPDELTVWGTFTTLPPAPPFPPELQGQQVLMLDVCYVGDLAAGAQAVAPLRSSTTPDLDMAQPMPYMVRMTLLDEHAHPGMHHDATNTFLVDLSDAAIETLIAQVRQITTPLYAVQVAYIGGAVARVPADATAFAHRDAAYLLWLPLTWAPDDDATRHRQWMFDALSAMQLFSTGGAYVNALSDEGAAGVQRAYPPQTLARLQALKRQYDPDNLFRSNQNILPA